MDLKVAFLVRKAEVKKFIALPNGIVDPACVQKSEGNSSEGMK
jgi:hypothetical protein